MVLKIVANYEAPKHCEIYDFHQKLHFQITSSGGVTPDKGNPLIKRLQEALENYVYHEGCIKATILDVDDFSCEQRNPNLVEGHWDVVEWHVYDKDPSEERRVFRYNNEIKALLYSLLMKLKFSHYKTTIQVVLDQMGQDY